jgi:hypothetical protein
MNENEVNYDDPQCFQTFRECSELKRWELYKEKRKDVQDLAVWKMQAEVYIAELEIDRAIRKHGEDSPFVAEAQRRFEKRKTEYEAWQKSGRPRLRKYKMKEIDISVVTPSDTSAGILPREIKITGMPVSSENRDEIRETLSGVFRELLAEPCFIFFSDECGDCGKSLVDGHCVNPNCISHHSSN